MGPGKVASGRSGRGVKVGEGGRRSKVGVGCGRVGACRCCAAGCTLVVEVVIVIDNAL